MRKILAAVLLLSTSAGAMAIERYDSRGMACSAIQAALEKDGAAILYRQASGLPLYDRYVASSRFCDSTATAVWSSVPASDTQGVPREKMQERRSVELLISRESQEGRTDEE